jgi:hypothetical protein
MVPPDRQKSWRAGRKEHDLKNRFLPIKPLYGVIAAVAAMVLTLGAFAGVAFADQTVHVKHASLGDVQGPCAPGSITLWHFVITDMTDDTAPANIHVYWDTPADTDVPLEKVTPSPQGGVAHYTTTLHQGSLVTDATALVPDDWTGQFNLSHVTCEQNAAESAVTTTVHDAEDNETTSVPLGTQVHDTVNLTTDPTPVTLPNGSSITVNFFDGDCSTTAVDSAVTSVGENTPYTNSPVNLENQLPKTVGVGQHAYQASFTSGDTDVVKSSTGLCEPFEVTKGTSSTTTEVHDAGHADITDGQVALGAVVHDTATVSGVPNFPVNSDGTGTVTFSLYNSSDCKSNLISVEPNVSLGTTDLGNGATKSTDTSPLAAGQYGYQATYNGDSSYLPSTGLCEPFEVTRNDTTTTTQVHANGDHTTDLTGKGVAVGTYVHDKATVSGNPEEPGFAIDGTVTFRLYNSSDCTSNLMSEEKDVTIGSDPTDGTRSTATQITIPGNYGYQATYSGNGNYKESTGTCEPFSVFQPGKTMGYWGNTNGQAKIAAPVIVNGIPVNGYEANQQFIGRNSEIDTKAESLKVLPNTLNACGKGTPFIFTVGAQTGTTDCTLANGVNKSSLNTLAAQTLALGYNLKPALRPGFAGQTLGQLQCSAGTTGLNNGSTVEDAFAAAVALINGSAAGGTTTQSQIGAMNTLLGCLNREA